MAVTESKGDGYALYNGVKLPNIDTVWTDKEKYSHAAIFDGMEFPDVNAMVLILSSEAPTYSNVTVTTGGRYSVAKLANSEWSILDEGDNSGTNQLIGFPINIAPLAWTSHDIINIDDNSLYLAASAPIPLDGMNVIEWDGDTTGLETLSDNYVKIAEFENASGAVVVNNTNEKLKTGIAFVEENGCWMAGIDTAESPLVYALNDEGGSAYGVSSGIYAFYATYENTLVSYITLLAYTPAATEYPEEPETPTVKKFPLRQFILGLLTELTAGTAKEPIAYLYNGVRLPKLPEWDRGVYPYAFILYIGGLVQAYRLYLTPEITYKSAGDNWIIGHADNSCSYSAHDGEWKLYTEYPSGNDGLDSVENTIWANTDLLNEDGSVCLAKSEPIPVYE